MFNIVCVDLKRAAFYVKRSRITAIMFLREFIL